MRRYIKWNIQPDTKCSVKDGTFTWAGSHTIPDDDYVGGCNKNTHEASFIGEFLTVIIDDNNVFKTKDVITSINRRITIDDYVLSDRLAPIRSVHVSNSGIDRQLRTMSDSCISAHSDLNYSDILFSAIYKEKWENIRPMRIEKQQYDDSEYECRVPVWELIHKKMESVYDYKKEELEEIKNVESGAPPTRNDICPFCNMYLYGDIYVIEYNGNHQCICDMCMNAWNREGKNYVSQLGRYTILRVKYPRDIGDVIDMITDDKEQRLFLKEISTAIIAPTGVVSKNYMSVGDLYKYLHRKRQIPEGKKIFEIA